MEEDDEIMRELAELDQEENGIVAGKMKKPEVSTDELIQRMKELEIPDSKIEVGAPARKEAVLSWSCGLEIVN